MNKVVARYSDGRMIKGSTSDFVPADSAANIERCYVVSAATTEVTLL